MTSDVDRKMNDRHWRFFLEDARHEWPDPGIDLSRAADLNQLASALGRAVGLSESRAKREIQRLLRRFEEKMQRAA
jgi:hypothetical protein